MRAIVMLLMLAACAGAPAESEMSDCERAVENAAVIDSSRDAVEDLDPAIRTCGSLGELERFADRYPEALDGAGARTFVTNRCQAAAALRSTAICRELGF